MAVLLGVFLLWVLNSINSSISAIRPLLDEMEVVLSSREGELELDESMVQSLVDRGNVTSMEVGINPSEGEKGKSIGLVPKTVLEHVRDGKRVFLRRDIVAKRILSAKDTELIRRHKHPDDTIAVKTLGQPGQKFIKLSILSERIEKGDKYELASNISVPTWWFNTIMTVPGIEVDLAYGNIITVMIFVLGVFGIFTLANGRRASDFLIETESELKRVDWPSRPEVFASTKVVIVMVIIFMIMLFVYDYIYGMIISWIKNIFFGKA